MAEPIVITPEIEARFWAKVDKNGPVPECRPDLGPCWIWTASLSIGYGQFKVPHRRSAGAHVFAWFVATGKMPVFTLDHLCRTRRCVRPSHLEDIPRAENTKRANPRWTHCARGHELSGENVYHWRGHRRCRTCAIQRGRDYWQRNREYHRKLFRDWWYKKGGREKVRLRKQKGRPWGGSGKGWNGFKTQCKYGHPFDASNTYMAKGGHRVCRACMATYQRRLRATRRAQRESIRNSVINGTT